MQDKSLAEGFLAAFNESLAPPPVPDPESARSIVQSLPFSTMIENTSTLTLDPWQRHLAARLEKLAYQRGQRILIHKPPQHGGSVIVSQRLPAYLLGVNPFLRLKLACYNITHASGFSRVVKEVMCMPEFKSMFRNEDCRVTQRSADESWFTMGRRRMQDAQPSFKSLGLETGFVGQGADDLIVDDPYPSPQAAASPTIRETTWKFWDESARVRLNEDSNVVVMFHRYGEDDFAGRLMREEPGVWELIQYAAIFDGDWDITDTPYRVSNAPDNVVRDPIGRKRGEKLSPRMSDEFYEKQRARTTVWMGQFQGRPTGKDGNLFNVDKMLIVDAPETRILRYCRAWDLAATEGGGAYTVGVLMGIGADGNIYVLDVVRFQHEPDRRDKRILRVTTSDQHRYGKGSPTGVPIRLPQDPGQAGKSQVKSLIKKLRGFKVVYETVSGSKVVRADQFASDANAGNVYLIKGPWNKDYKEEHKNFPSGTYSDQVDASADAYDEVALDFQAPLEQFDRLGLYGDPEETDEQRLLQEILRGELGEYDGITLH